VINFTTAGFILRFPSVYKEMTASKVVFKEPCQGVRNGYTKVPTSNLIYSNRRATAQTSVTFL